jgi:hypothetical protein
VSAGAHRIPRADLPGTVRCAPLARVDTGVAHIARVYDYWLGGKDNFAADREAAALVISSYPDILASVRAQRAFLSHAVTYLAAEAGIRQFLDIGTGLPSARNTHEVAQEVAPGSRIVYVDNDPMVLAHARALLTSNCQGATAYLDADLRDTGAIIRDAARMLDFGRPVAVMLLGILHCVPDSDDPAGIVRQLRDAVPPGSYLVISHPASDIHATAIRTATTLANAVLAEPVTLRSHTEVAGFFAGWDLVPPGLVQVHRWRTIPDDADTSLFIPGGLGGSPPPVDLSLANYGGVARKP